MIRTSGTFADISSQCDSPFRNGGTPLPPASGSYAACKRLLSRVPVQLDHIDKQAEQHPAVHRRVDQPDASSCEVMAGTQDNGTWSNLNNCNRNTLPQIIYGDGGNAGYDATEPTWRVQRVHERLQRLELQERRSRAVGDQLRSGREQRRVHRVLLAAGQRSEPGSGHAPDLLGREARLADLGLRGRPAGCRAAGHDPRHRLLRGELSGVRDLGRPDPDCGDYRPLGGPYCDGIASTATPTCINQPGDLAGTVYGTDRAGGCDLVDRA